MSVKEFDGHLQKNHKVSVGIDQSLTGFAFSAVSVESPQEHHTWVFKSPYKGVQRLQDIQDFLYERFEELRENDNEIHDIAMEGTVLASQAALVLGELAATVKLFMYEHFWGLNHYTSEPPRHLLTPLQVPPMTLKKYATGKGTAKKQEMLLQIFKRWGIEFNDDNAADAYALGRLAGGHAIDKIEQEVVDKMNDIKYRDVIQ
jgi:Holliday junction resolvasome RuvABC endonuclease subunit